MLLIIIFINPVTYIPFLILKIYFCLKAKIKKTDNMKNWKGIDQ